uniref:Uncharacterized protein n=1 Tax=Meloidogyne hapla TaxID=6305 RepID=A0A1I8BLH9_MELHA
MMKCIGTDLAKNIEKKKKQEQQQIAANLSCRVIAGICQGDIRCLEEMGTRFPNCYLESLLGA